MRFTNNLLPSPLFHMMRLYKTALRAIAAALSWFSYRSPLFL